MKNKLRRYKRAFASTFQTDGSTLPSIIKHWNIDGVWKAGRNHDKRLSIDVNKRQRVSAYFYYLGDLFRFGVELYKILVLAFGLGVHQSLPRPLRECIRDWAKDDD